MSNAMNREEQSSRNTSSVPEQAFHLHNEDLGMTDVKPDQQHSIFDGTHQSGPDSQDNKEINLDKKDLKVSNGRNNDYSDYQASKETELNTVLRTVRQDSSQDGHSLRVITSTRDAAVTHGTQESNRVQSQPQQLTNPEIVSMYQKSQRVGQLLKDSVIGQRRKQTDKIKMVANRSDLTTVNSQNRRDSGVADGLHVDPITNWGFQVAPGANSTMTSGIFKPRTQTAGVAVTNPRGQEIYYGARQQSAMATNHRRGHSMGQPLSGGPQPRMTSAVASYKMRKNMQQQNRQINRYSKLQSYQGSSDFRNSVAVSRKDRTKKFELGTNFPVQETRDKSRSNLQTSLKYKLSDAANAMTHAESSNFNEQTEGTHRVDAFPVNQSYQKQKTLSSQFVVDKTRKIQTAATGQGRQNYKLMQQTGTDFGIVDADVLNFARPNTGAETTSRVESMQQRNQMMRNDVKHQDEIASLNKVIFSQQDEIKQLREKMRELFEQDQERIVSAAYDGQTQDISYMSAGQGTPFKSTHRRHGPTASVMTPVVAHDSMMGDRGSACAMRNVSNIHSLYQDLYVNDMRDDLAFAGEEREAMRQELLQKDQENDKLRKENDYVKSRLNIYRRMVKDLQQPGQNQEGSKKKKQTTTIFSAQKGHGTIGNTTQSLAMDIQNQEVRGNSSSAEINDEPDFDRPGKSMNSIEGVSPMIDAKRTGGLSYNTQGSIDSGAGGTTDGMTNFAKEVNKIVEVLKSGTLKQVFHNASVVLKKILRCSDVTFMFIDKLISKQFKSQENGKVNSIYHAHMSLDLVVPDSFDGGVSKKEFDFVPQFQNIRDVDKGKVCQGKFAVWPVKSLSDSSNTILLFQCSHSSLESRKFSFMKDAKVMEAVASVISVVVDRIIVSSKIEASQHRAFQILDTFRQFLGERRHVPLCQCLERVFPVLFKFQECGVLFVDKVTGNLFKIQHLPKNEDGEVLNGKALTHGREFENIVRFPKNIGLTGIAISEKKLIKFDKGKKMHQFLTEIDNQVGTTSIESMLIGPIYDQEGEIKGVIQLVNKEGGIVTEQDELELKSLLPSLGEIIKTADEVRMIHNISTGVDQYLISTKNDIFEAADKLDERQMTNIEGCVSQVHHLVGELIWNKKVDAFTDPAMATDIIKILRKMQAKDPERAQRVKDKMKHLTNDVMLTITSPGRDSQM